MKIDFESEAEIFRLLGDLARLSARDGLTLRVAGGVAVHAWMNHQQRRGRILTQDIDVVLRTDGLGTVEEAKASAAVIRERLDSVGFARPRKGGRLHYARFAHHNGRNYLDLLCGSLPVGGMSEPPRYRIVRSQLYASQILWLDFLEEEWIEVDATCGEAEFKLEIPRLPALSLLKVLALAGKLALIERAENEKSAEYEERQFVEHARDLLSLSELMEARAELPDLVELSRRSKEVPATAQGVSLAIQDSPSPFRSGDALTYLAEATADLVRVLDL